MPQYPSKITSAGFVKSSSVLSQCPPASLPEFAFIGRSNVGKSSLINMLTGVKNLAKTSSTPGKTQLINHYLINESWYLVDLPGYGYAALSKSAKAALSEMIGSYLNGRTNLLNIYLLVDVRHAPQPVDLEFMAWLAGSGLPFTIVFTKADKLTKQQLSRQVDLYRRSLSEEWEELPPMLITSSDTGAGRKELLQEITTLCGRSGEE